MVTEVIQGEQEIESAAEEERFARLFNLLAARFNIFRQMADQCLPIEI